MSDSVNILLLATHWCIPNIYINTVYFVSVVQFNASHRYCGKSRIPPLLLCPALYVTLRIVHFHVHFMYSSASSVGEVFILYNIWSVAIVTVTV